MVVKTSQVSYRSLSSWVQGELLRRAINSSPSKSKPCLNARPRKDQWNHIIVFCLQIDATYVHLKDVHPWLQWPISLLTHVKLCIIEDGWFKTRHLCHPTMHLFIFIFFFLGVTMTSWFSLYSATQIRRVKNKNKTKQKHTHTHTHKHKQTIENKQINKQNTKKKTGTLVNRIISFS